MDYSSLPDETAFRFVAVLNRKIETGKLMNALGHMTAGLAGKVGKPANMHFLEYWDKEGGIHPGISHFPFIVLSAENSDKIRIVRMAAIAGGVPYVDFTSTMTIGTTADQIEATANSPEENLEYYGIVMFGPTPVLREFTGKLSLFR